MQHTVALPMIQFLAWVAERPRTYQDVMDAWRSSCPRLSVWEDSMIEGYVSYGGDTACTIILTPLGQAVLKQGSQPNHQMAAR
ncbi:MAG: hypothetical protein JO227_18420 [Acetobacteraceae bacterium]|nr:hypothetical protein [Acetobacteraceae bacterium]